jgi:hypothetical protein
MDGNQFIIKAVKATDEGETEDLDYLLAKVATDIHLLEPRPRFSCYYRVLCCQFSFLFALQPLVYPEMYG